MATPNETQVTVLSDEMCDALCTFFVKMKVGDLTQFQLELWSRLTYFDSPLVTFLSALGNEECHVQASLDEHRQGGSLFTETVSYHGEFYRACDDQNGDFQDHLVSVHTAAPSDPPLVWEDLSELWYGKPKQ
jgi:hypothetical protein